ncbi:MAG: hypothetical protein J7474_03805 [Arthrobacter sp.]|nr:hypothetical protein [Arthrobacter sp.]
MTDGARLPLDPQVAVILASDRYARRSAELGRDLAVISDGLRSEDAAQRLAAVKTLSKLARAELSWLVLPVREHFLAEGTRAGLRAALQAAAADDDGGKTVPLLLNTVRHAAERYVAHPMWAPVSSPEEVRTWRNWVGSWAGEYAEESAPAVKVEAAYLLAFCGDPQAWDVFQSVVPRRSAALGQLELAVLQYPGSISPSVAAELRDLAERTAAAHPRQRFVADGIREALAGAEKP